MHAFICKVLPYKSKIDEGNESFFLDKSFSDDTDDSGILGKIFEMKNLWKQLNDSNKKFVIQYMKLLCEMSQEYYDCYSSKKK